MIKKYTLKVFSSLIFDFLDLANFLIFLVVNKFLTFFINITINNITNISLFIIIKTKYVIKTIEKILAI